MGGHVRSLYIYIVRCRFWNISLDIVQCGSDEVLPGSALFAGVQHHGTADVAVVLHQAERVQVRVDVGAVVPDCIPARLPERRRPPVVHVV